MFSSVQPFEDRYLNEKKNQLLLIANHNPVPTILSQSQQNLPKLVHPSMKTPRRMPVECQSNYSQYKKLKNEDKSKSFFDIHDILLKKLGNNFFFGKYYDNAVFLAMDSNQLSVPRVTYCIPVDLELRVKLFYEGSPLNSPFASLVL